MIVWAETRDSPDAERAFRTDVYRRLIRATDADEQEKQSLREVACALTRVWSDDFNRQLSSTRLFSLLGSQACWMLGQRRVAERLVQWLSLEPFESRAVMDLIRSGRLTVRTGTGLASRLVRPSTWAAGSCRDAWILDMTRVFGESLGSLDLLLAPRLRRVVEQLCELWDSTKGEGVLVLEMSDRDSDNPPHASLLEVVRYCMLVLEGVRERRCWKHVPQIRIQQATTRKQVDSLKNPKICPGD